MDSSKNQYLCSRARFYFKDSIYPLTFEEYNDRKRAVKNFQNSEKAKKIREKLASYIKDEINKK